MAKSSAAPATRSVTDWRIATQGFPALGDGTNRLAVTPKELDKMLTTYAKYAHQALYEALSAARDAFKTISDKVGGNEQINEPDAAAFYRGYNAVLRADQAIANESLSKITAALALADAAQEGEANGG